MKIAIVGDPHISEKTPRCRVDNYLETVLGKLEFIAKNNDKVIILGDLFHIHSNSTLLFNLVYQMFSKYPNKFISILGNHDIFHNNISALNRTTIGSLVYTGVLDLKLSGFELDGVQFEVSNVLKDMDKIPVDKNNEKILLGHNFYNMELSPKESFTHDDIEKLNYKIVFLGHDHKPYDEEFVGNSILIRMGSLTRIDTQEYNKERKIYYYQLDTETMEYSKVPVPCKSITEVYNENAYDKVRLVKTQLSFSDIGAVLAKFNKQKEGSISLDKVLVNLGATTKQRNYIKFMHELSGVDYN